MRRHRGRDAYGEPAERMQGSETHKLARFARLRHEERCSRGMCDDCRRQYHVVGNDDKHRREYRQRIHDDIHQVHTADHRTLCSEKDDPGGCRDQCGNGIQRPLFCGERQHRGTPRDRLSGGQPARRLRLRKRDALQEQADKGICRR